VASCGRVNKIGYQHAVKSGRRAPHTTANSAVYEPIEIRKNKTLVLKAFDTLFNKKDFASHRSTQIRSHAGGKLLPSDLCNIWSNVLEQDHRPIKRRVRASQHFRSFWGAWRTIAGYEAIHMIRKGQACSPSSHLCEIPCFKVNLRSFVVGGLVLAEFLLTRVLINRNRSKRKFLDWEDWTLSISV
jgi:hypothetical protein